MMGGMEHTARFDGKVFVPSGAVDFEKGAEVVVRRRATAKGVIGRDLLKSGFLGAWKNRKDITDSAAFARKLRAQSNKPRYRI